MVGQTLPWQGVHQVKVEGVEHLRCFLYGGARLGAIVHAPQGLQKAVVKALHADGQARHPRCAQGAKAVFLERAGVGFQGDFAVGLQAQARAQIRQQALDAGRCKPAGRATANEDADHLAAPDQRQRCL